MMADRPMSVNELRNRLMKVAGTRVPKSAVEGWSAEEFLEVIRWLRLAEKGKMIGPPSIVSEWYRACSHGGGDDCNGDGTHQCLCCLQFFCEFHITSALDGFHRCLACSENWIHGDGSCKIPSEYDCKLERYVAVDPFLTEAPTEPGFYWFASPIAIEGMGHVMRPIVIQLFSGGWFEINGIENSYYPKDYPGAVYRRIPIPEKIYLRDGSIFTRYVIGVDPATYPATVIICEECGKHPADLPSKLCQGCSSYKEHQS